MSESQISWFSLEDEGYTMLLPDEQDIIRSMIFPGLDLNVQALLAEDLATVLTEVQRSVVTEKHQAFVGQLAKKQN